MHVDVLNAVVRERARIREEVIKLEGHSHPGTSDPVYVARGEVLAIITENVLKEGEEVTDELT